MMKPNKGPKLSILLVTYNHEGYVDRAIDSIINQDTPGPIELVIADDASTDATLERIRAHEARDARLTFKYLAADANIGITRNYQRGFSACTGEYVAILEGDDYWTSPRKLARQAAFLDEHWECGLCSVNYFVLQEANATFSPRVPIGKGHRLLDARDLIADNLVGNFSTCMYRRSALESLPAELFEVRSYDWIVNICVASHSLIGFLEEPMSVYRIHASGAWSNHDEVEKLKLQLSLIPAYDQITRRRFHAAFSQLENDLGERIRIIQTGDAIKGLARPLSRGMGRVIDFTPPIIISIVKAVTPPVLARMLLRLARWGMRQR